MGIRAKLGLPMLLAFVLFACQLHFFWVKDYIAEARQLRLRQEQSVLAALSPGLIRALLANDLASLHATLDYIMEVNANEWKELQLINNNGRRLYPLSHAAVKPSEYLTTITYPLFWEGERVGALQLSINMEYQITEITRRITELEILALLIFGGISVLAVFWQNRWIRKPLLELQKAAGNLARGNFDVRLPKARRDEVGQLSQAFESMRDQIRLAREGLEVRVEARTHELVLARDEADRANKSKSEFLARMSHELRTPLNAILGFGQLLQMDDDNLEDEQKIAIKHIMIGGRHLLQLINEVLDIVQVDAGKMSLDIKSVSLNEAVEMTINLIKPLAVNHQIVIKPVTIPAECVVRADLQRLKQVLVNLLSNAVKYNRRGGEVRVDCRIVAATAGESGGRMANLAVTDTGIGIQEQDFDKVFEPFQRVILRGENIEGTGVGLSITKKMIELMRGRLGFDSKFGKGSTFWVELPLAETGEVEAMKPAEKLPARHRLPGTGTLLYVEDKVDNVIVIQRLIETTTNWKFLSASTAEQGIEIARRQLPDIILMDINLPGMHGTEALAILRIDEQTAGIPVIAVSAHKLDRPLASGSDFDDFILKPVEFDTLLQVIDRQLTKPV